MKPADAVKLLDNIVGQVAMSRVDHQKASEAINVLASMVVVVEQSAKKHVETAQEQSDAD